MEFRILGKLEVRGSARPVRRQDVSSRVVCGATRIASVLQASRFRGDVTAFRLNAAVVCESGAESAFRRNTAERVYITEAAHNPEVAGSNPAPATAKGAGNGAVRLFFASHPVAERARLRSASPALFMPLTDGVLLTPDQRGWRADLTDEEDDPLYVICFRCTSSATTIAIETSSSSVKQTPRDYHA
jgi:hypothetical protein